MYWQRCVGAFNCHVCFRNEIYLDRPLSHKSPEHEQGNSVVRCSVLQCVAARCSLCVCCNTLQCVAASCSVCVCCSALQCVAERDMQDEALYCTLPRGPGSSCTFLSATHCNTPNTPQHTATHRNTLQHTGWNHGPRLLSQTSHSI